ncbi:MAG: hypothetical protein E7599_06130 [Ruminococcaceae bacterium]|nr:hypothetical protein [Oscillospiraceae bacterium]
MLGALMFCSKMVMEALPNIHLVGALTMVYTVVFRWKALIPLYVYVMLDGLFHGFAMWWVPYLYVWTVLWAVTMLLPKRMPKAVALIVYPAVCALHGLFFGVLYAPAQALMFGFDFEQTLTWIAAGLYFDIAHFFGDLFAGLLILPLAELLKRLTKKIY